MKSVIFIGTKYCGHNLIISYLGLHKDVCFNIPEADKKIIIFENLEYFSCDKTNAKVKWIHVARNPFDELGLEISESKIGFESVLKKYIDINIRIQRLYAEEEVLSLSYEVAIRNFRRILVQLSNYLGIENNKEWERAVAQFIIKNKISLQFPRHLIAWDESMKNKVDGTTKQFPWTKVYTIRT